MMDKVIRSEIERLNERLDTLESKFVIKKIVDFDFDNIKNQFEFEFNTDSKYLCMELFLDSNAEINLLLNDVLYTVSNKSYSHFEFENNKTKSLNTLTVTKISEFACRGVLHLSGLGLRIKKEN